MNRCEHTGHEPVRAGPYELLAAGTMYSGFGDGLDRPERLTLVALTREFHWSLLARHELLPFYLPDFGGVPNDWRDQLEGAILPRLEAGERLLVFCAGSHGRTGTFLASLIALLETPEETFDPIAAVRERHCVKSVETYAQAAGVLALRGEPLWPTYWQGLHGSLKASLGPDT